MNSSMPLQSFEYSSFNKVFKLPKSLYSKRLMGNQMIASAEIRNSSLWDWLQSIWIKLFEVKSFSDPWCVDYLKTLHSCPFLLNMCMMLLGEVIIHQFGIRFQQYADCNQGNTIFQHRSTMGCLEVVGNWTDRNWLKFNHDKTE